MSKNADDTPIRLRLLEFIQEDNGSFSATRLAFLLWIIGVLVVWIVESIKNKKLEDINSDVTTIIGILMTGKVVQKFGEKPDGDPSPSTSDGTPASSEQKTTNTDGGGPGSGVVSGGGDH